MFNTENDNGILWLIIIFVLLFNNGGFGGGNSSALQGYATQSEMSRGFDNQNIMNRFDSLQTAQTQGAYENAQLINSMNINTMNGFNTVNANISNLAHQMEQCCCNLKTQMLQDKYDDVRNQLNQAQIATSNAVQTDNILSTMGKWYANQPYCYYNGTTIS